MSFSKQSVSSFLALSNSTVSQTALVAVFGSVESSDVTQRSCMIGFTSEAPCALEFLRYC